jgi:tRNA modification GTPase
MFSTADTIVAIATAPGRGAIGIVRLSGPDAIRIAGDLLGPRSLEPRYATYAAIDTGTIRDQVVVTAYPQPHSYTGEDVVEISAHGSAVVLTAIVQAAITAGARLAQPGEFTLRAFLNGKIDLPQAEAVADLIDAATPLQAQTAFDQLNGTLSTAVRAIDDELFDLIARLEASIDFPEEGYHFIEPGAVGRAIDSVRQRIDALLSSSGRGRIVREGVQVAIVGSPNAGKSSLFNALVGAHRAIVTAIPGTTRDVLSEVVDLGGVRVTLVDTAGIGETTDPIEQEGIRRARQAADSCDVMLVVCDGTQPCNADAFLPHAGRSMQRAIVVASKADLPALWHRDDAIAVSTVTGHGLDRLIDQILVNFDCAVERDVPSVSNVRHIRLLGEVKESLTGAAAALSDSAGTLPEEFVLSDLQRARMLLEQIMGLRGAEAHLEYIFSRFCVGK